ncbi:Flagellar hook-associated protein FlgL, partial [hydrothermal vent metagenome]
MRVSTTLIQQQGLQNILRKQADLLRVQTELSSGKKITKPSDDPSGASRVLDINNAIAQITQYGENASFATQRLNLEESTLSSANLVLQRVRELSIQAANT